MNKILLPLLLTIFSLTSCREEKIENLKFEGDPVTKTILATSFDMPVKYQDPEFGWYISFSPLPDGKWEKLPGIWTNEIALLTSYVGKYNISTHTLAAKAGNKHSIVTYNYGFGEIQVNTPYCDYSSGEKRPQMNIRRQDGLRMVYNGSCSHILVKNGEARGNSSGPKN